MKKISIFVILIFVSFSILQAQWSQVGVNVNGEASGDNSGCSVSISSDGLVMAIGAKNNDGNGDNSGHVRVYENIAGSWIKIGNDIDGEGVGDSFGYSISLNANGSVIAIGAPNNSGGGSGAGHLRVFENLEGVWTQIGNDIDGNAADDNFGHSVDISDDGTIVAVGSIGNGAGHVKIFKNESGFWLLLGDVISGEFDEDEFGYSVSLNSDGSIIAVGAVKNTLLAGHVRIYENLEGTWTQIGSDIDGEASNDMSGCSVSLSSDGTIVAIGAYGNNGNYPASGHVRVFKNTDETWTQIGNDIDGEKEDDWFGWSLDLSADGSVIIIGAQYNDNGGADAGNARIFRNHNGAWTLIGSDINGESVNDRFGVSVCLSSNGSIVAIGAIDNDGNGANAGHVRVFGHIPFIINQPSNNIGVCNCQIVSFKINEKFTNNYQWQVSTNSGSNWSDISDNETYSKSTTDSLVVLTDISLNNNIYRCYITNDYGNLTSNSALLTVIDNVDPTISCVENKEKQLSQGETLYTVSGTEFDPTEIYDNCCIDSVYNDYNELSSLAGEDFQIGDTTVKWIIVDKAGNRDTCSFNVQINEYVGIESLEHNGISIYPNPINEHFFINSEELVIKNVEIDDLTGKKIFNSSYSTQNLKIDLSSFNSGIYIIKIQTHNRMFSAKIVKK